MRKLLVLTASLALAGCVAPSAPGGPRPVRIPPGSSALALVMGRTAAELVATFGDPDQDFREDSARKLQFANASCVLDAYLYPQRRGAEPVVTYVDARNPAGEDVDREACVATFTRRR